MVRILLYIIILCLVFAGIYTLFANKISNYLSTKYDVELNKGRENNDLVPISDNWKLDSVKYDKHFESYIQFWSPSNKDTNNAYLKNKWILFNKSFWFWNNYAWGEIDYYINPLNKYEYAELYILYDYKLNKWSSAIDTFETEYKILKEKLEIEKVIAERNVFICGGLVDLSMSTELSKSEANEILNSWKLK